MSCIRKAAALLWVVGTLAAARAETIGAAFSGIYNLTTIAPPAGLVSSYYTGGLVFESGDPNVLLFGMYADSAAGRILAVDVTRDSVTQGVTGFTGSASTDSSSPYIDAGLTYGPGGYLFFTATTNTIGEIKPGSTSPDYTVSLPGVTASTGGLDFIPAGFGSAGNAAITSYNGESICSATVALQGDGSYAFGTCTDTVSLSSTVEGIQYVSAGTPGFSANSVLINFYSPYGSGSVVAYQVDSNGMPILSTARSFITGLQEAEGITLDPVTGDILADPVDGANAQWIVASAAPEPDSFGLTLAAFAVLAAGPGIHAARRSGGGGLSPVRTE